MKLLLAFALLATLQWPVSCLPNDFEKEEGLDFSLLVSSMQPRECTREGLMCKTCTELVNCVRDSKEPSGFKEISQVTCNSDFPCDELVGGCVRNGICRNGPFICPRTDNLEPMDYPDLYDCTKYHECTGRNDVAKQCESKQQAWDPRRGDCVARMGEVCKSYPVPLCREEGEKGSIQGSLYSFRCVLDFAEGIDMLYPRLQWNSTSA
ncbi:uncharacterized protein LOC124159545 [Ischnura elegans]|uniref:uncharacterized protein LOC124159545 n=1 Tax=Ischnura elegans TaxID=197161 RepID=UPI001ED8A7E1|nr:uncharacterized protein LOC124159545 [Ischnura elegans]